MGPWKETRPSPIEEPGLDGGHVAVGEERLGVRADQVEIEAIEKVVGSVTATGTNDGGDGGIGEGGVQIGEAVFDGAGKVGRMLCRRRARRATTS